MFLQLKASSFAIRLGIFTATSKYSNIKKLLILFQFRICFSYQSLANSTVEGSRASSSSNKILSDWEFELGEAALDVQYIGTYVVTLGERHLYCLKDTDGTIVWTRKLDYHPMCCTLLIPRLYSII